MRGVIVPFVSLPEKSARENLAALSRTPAVWATSMAETRYRGLR